MFPWNDVFCVLVLAVMLFGAPVGSYDEQCGPVFRSNRRFGAKHLSQMSINSKEAIMKCRNISESAALERDAQFEERRHLCIGLVFPSVPEEQLEEHLCRFTRMDDSEDVQKLRNLTACLKQGHDAFGKDERQVLELRASRIECMQKYFPGDPRGVQDRKYANLVKRVNALTHSVMYTNQQILFCMRQYQVPEEEARERNKAKASCMRRLLPDVAPERLESVFVEYLKNRSAYLDDALTLCSYLETPAGKWARENIMISHKCIREVLPHMPSRARSALSFRIGLDVQEEVMDKVLRCESKGGTPLAFEGMLRPEYLHCLSFRRKRPINLEMFDSSTVYDNPDPQQKLTLCIMHKRSSSEALMQYRQYLTSAAKEEKRVQDCYNRHLGIPVGWTTISGSAESDFASDASTAVYSEVPTDEQPTTAAPQENEVWSTVVPMTAATSEPDTVRSE